DARGRAPRFEARLAAPAGDGARGRLDPDHVGVRRDAPPAVDPHGLRARRRPGALAQREVLALLVPRRHEERGVSVRGAGEGELDRRAPLYASLGRSKVARMRFDRSRNPCLSSGPGAAGWSRPVSAPRGPSHRITVPSASRRGWGTALPGPPGVIALEYF